MKKLFLALMLVFFVSSFSFAQINKGWDGTKPEVYQGAKSLVFLYSPFVSTNFSGNFAGSILPINANGTDTTLWPAASISQLYGIGFQYYVTHQISLVAGFNFGSSSTEYQYTGPAHSLKISQTTFGFSVDGNYHFKSLYSVSPYLGLNVNIGMNSLTADEVSGGVTYTYKCSNTVIGAGLNLGFDWYFTPGLSLGGKYTLGMQASTSGNEVTVTSGATTITNKSPKYSSLGTGIASIMLNVHF
jgi:hypothetical protein